MRLTASRIALAQRCTWWARTDAVIPANDASAAAQVGTSLHAVAERESEEVNEALVDEQFGRVAGRAGAMSVDGLSPADRKALEQLVVSWRRWWPTFSRDFQDLDVEVPYALDLATGKARKLPSEGQRDYSAATSTEIPGTIDLVAQREAELVVLDYKTGRGPHKYADHEEQMRFLGAVAALEHGASFVRVIVAHVTADGVHLDERVLDSLEIAMVVYELRELVAGVEASAARPGLHCEDGWCPARAVCPTTRALLVAAQVPADARRRLPLVGPLESNEDTYATLVAIDLVEAWIADRRKAAKAFADREPVRAPDGRTYRAREVERESPRLDVEGAEAALERAIGPEAIAKAVEVKRSTSWTAIKDAVRAVGGVAKDAEEHARAELRAVGAVKVSKFNSYEWKKEKRA